MGEYAKRISDDQIIKIGTCEEMLYLRFEDIPKISTKGQNCVQNLYMDGLYWRLPFPDADSFSTSPAITAKDCPTSPSRCEFFGTVKQP